MCRLVVRLVTRAALPLRGELWGYHPIVGFVRKSHCGAMRNTLGYPTFGSSNFEANRTFNVMIVYEDFESGKHAKRTYDVLAENLGKDCKCSNQMWKFDLLTVPKLREIAAKDAGSADIVLLSVRGPHDLPAEVKSWLTLWLSTPSRAVALVALFDPSEQNKERWLAICSFLSELAKTAGLEFFAQPDNEAPVADSLENFIFQRNSSPVSHIVLQAANLEQHEHSGPRWGINE